MRVSLGGSGILHHFSGLVVLLLGITQRKVAMYSLNTYFWSGTCGFPILICKISAIPSKQDKSGLDQMMVMPLPVQIYPYLYNQLRPT